MRRRSKGVPSNPVLAMLERQREGARFDLEHSLQTLRAHIAETRAKIARLRSALLWNWGAEETHAERVLFWALMVRCYWREHCPGARAAVRRDRERLAEIEEALRAERRRSQDERRRAQRGGP